MANGTNATTPWGMVKIGTGDTCPLCGRSLKLRGARLAVSDEGILVHESCADDAGRILSRTAAKDRLTLDEYREAMQGVWTSCVSKDTLDEAPQAYKSADMILGAIGESVRVLFVARPVYNFKAGGE